jgi:hypothetical protein
MALMRIQDRTDTSILKVLLDADADIIAFVNNAIRDRTDTSILKVLLDAGTRTDKTFFLTVLIELMRLAHTHENAEMLEFLLEEMWRRCLSHQEAADIRRARCEGRGGVSRQAEAVDLAEDDAVVLWVRDFVDLLWSHNPELNWKASPVQLRFLKNVNKERGNIIKELILSYDDPNLPKSYVEKKLDPALKKRWNMVRHNFEKDDEINIGEFISKIRSRGDFINHDPSFFEALIAKEFKMNTKDAKKNQERIEEKRGLHRRARVGLGK